MAIHVQRALRSFPPQQQADLMRALQGMRRRVDTNLTAVSLPVNATTTAATLTCPANELYEGACMHLQVSGTVTATSATTNTMTPLIALNGTTLWTDLCTVGAVNTTAKAFLIDCRIYWQTPFVVVASGLIAVSEDAVIAGTGTGSLDNVTATTSVTGGGTATNAGVDVTLAEAKITPIYHTLSSQVIGRDQIITVTMAMGAANISGSSKIASLWVD